MPTKPPSFVDVNDLRANLQHDLNHGKASKAASKRRRVGATFRKYAGDGAPQTLAPERFPVVQATLLDALERDLRELLKRTK